MKIAVDAFGGDNAPDEVLAGAADAVAEYDVEILLTGDEKRIKARFSGLGLSYKNIKIVNADGVIQVEDDPKDILKSKINSSMGTALKLVSEGSADAVVSAGSTGALVIGGTMLVGRMKGVKRSALAPILPSTTGFYIVLDVGANIECRPEMLLQFGVMGSIFMEKIMNINNPRVGLLNIGTEDNKGRDLDKETLSLFKSSPINFIGNIEARDPMLGISDVVVTDGFTGNIFLKTVEGMGRFIKEGMKEIFTTNMGTKIGFLFSKQGVENFSKKIDYKEIGGTPLLGTKKAVIKAHGSSDRRAFKNAIRQAKEYVECNAIAEMEKALSVKNDVDNSKGRSDGRK